MIIPFFQIVTDCRVLHMGLLCVTVWWGNWALIPACRGMISRQTQSMITKLGIAPRLDQLAETSAKEPQRQAIHTFDRRIN
jgi:hypothetical protein